MPIYEYRCSSCRDEFEVSQKISDAPLAACPKCQGPVEKMISQSSFVLKGGGWYKSDYGSKGSESAKGSCEASGSKPSCAGCPSAGD